MISNIKNYLESEKSIKTKPGRTLSGVAPAAVMTKPGTCKHIKKGIGPCTMCPGGLNSVFGSTPQSYTGNEPASMRGKRNKYDPYLQIFNRLEQYILLGHNVEKIELIVMGGSFLDFNKKYREEFITYCFKALNDFGKIFFKKKFDFKKFKKFFELPCDDIGNIERIEKLQKKILKLKGKSPLEREQKRNEKNRIRAVALCVESRPDITINDGKELLRLGVTRVEIGIQSLYDSVLDKINRGHKVSDSINCLKMLRELGFKVSVHYMIGLPGSTKKMDLYGFKKLFSDENFKPDMLKIYPCIVMKGTKLEEEYLNGKYKPMSNLEAAELIAEMKRIIPEYCRVQRIQRDITKGITAGVDKSNLRQDVKKIMKERNWECRCIRCREIGRTSKIGKEKLEVSEYNASNNKEFFIQITKGGLIGFCRLRFVNDYGIVRELHVYGESAELGKIGKVQHRGYGKLLMKKAEEICKKNKKRKLLVISGVGAKMYYKKLGYKKYGYYMSKTFS